MWVRLIRTFQVELVAISPAASVHECARCMRRAETVGWPKHHKDAVIMAFALSKAG